MCLGKVKVLDKFHAHRSYSRFSCGRCVVCRQKLADARANKIKHHNPGPNYTPYFVTLHYDNTFVPYIKRDEFVNLYFDAVDCHEETFLIPVYRSKELVRGFGSCFFVNHEVKLHEIEVVTSDIDITEFLYRDNISYTSTFVNGIRYKIGFNNYTYEHNKISICFSRDFQNFIKRLRVNLQRDSQIENSEFSFYYAPEYGPTTFRFHIHCILWLDSSISSEKVKSIIYKTWPFCSKDRLFKYIQVARDVASYVSSYVNCDTTLPKSLISIAPLRSSHSLHFGFDEDVYSLPKIVKNFQENHDVTFTATVMDKDNTPVTRRFVYPKYVLRYFLPKIKGYNRMSNSQRRLFYLSIPNTFTTHTLVGKTYTGVDLFQGSLVDSKGIPISFTRQEAISFFNSVMRSFAQFSRLGFSYVDFVQFIFDFYDAYSSYIYKSSFIDNGSIIDNTLVYFNLIDYDTFTYPQTSISEIFRNYHLSFNDYEFIPHELLENNSKFLKFYKNIKVRKLNSF